MTIRCTHKFDYYQQIAQRKVSYREARLVSFMFDGSLNGNWHPFDNLGVIPKEVRKQFLFDFADKTYWNPGRTGSTKHTVSTNADNTSQERTTVHEPQHPDKYYQSCRLMELQEGFTREELKPGFFTGTSSGDRPVWYNP
ncbi:hypothetical protein AGMMS50293_29670 [Spirochaetia bacterium]|nr:hypothetical protein AGMMS50293_29670 [Spirochaetia bacterium]